MAETTNKEFRPSQETVQKYLDGQAKVTCTALRTDAVKFGVLIAGIAIVATAWICTRHHNKTDE